MRNLILCLSLFLFASISSAQENDNALYVKYSKEEIRTMKIEQSQEYEYIKYCVSNAFYVATISQEKIDANPSSFGKIAIEDTSNINFYELKIELKENEYQPFIIEGTKKILMVKSKTAILREFNKIKK